MFIRLLFALVVGRFILQVLQGVIEKPGTAPLSFLECIDMLDLYCKLFCVINN